MTKLRLGILFGGQSEEHQVSLLSASNVIAALDKSKYEVYLIGIDQAGEWFFYESDKPFVDHPGDPGKIKLAHSNNRVAIVPTKEGGSLVSLSNNKLMSVLDVVFPVLHGLNGEDGTVQGLLKLAGVACVGADVMATAIGMDKDVSKRLARDAGLPIAKFKCFHISELDKLDFAAIERELGLPFFVKPANYGSSVGIAKIYNENEFLEKIHAAFKYDKKVLCEEFIDGREIECAVLGNEDPKTSIPGEIITHHDFYSYEAKYLDPNGADVCIPADLDKTQVEEVQKLAIKAYRAICCEGMARVDFFLNKNGKFFLNELNTIPGFTNISLYPKAWEASGVGYSELIDKLIQFAIER